MHQYLGPNSTAAVLMRYTVLSRRRNIGGGPERGSLSEFSEDPAGASAPILRRPRHLPFAFARPMPNSDSTIISRSNSLKMPSMPNGARPDGVLVSTA